MKKISALILCFAMLFTVLSVNVFAAESTGNVSVVTILSLLNNPLNYMCKTFRISIT